MVRKIFSQSTKRKCVADTKKMKCSGNSKQ